MPVAVTCECGHVTELADPDQPADRCDRLGVAVVEAVPKPEHVPLLGR